MTFALPDDLARQIEQIAAQENRSPIDVLREWIKRHQAPAAPEADSDPLETIAGIFDDDVEDLSVTVRETMQQFYKTRHADTD
mgnify:CR=1 FL=1